MAEKRIDEFINFYNILCMKYKLFFILASIVLIISCEDMHDKTREYYGEIVYPAKYDTIFGKVGYERVEIDLLKAGRIPPGEINLGKAKKTVIKYDDKVETIDGLVSWLNITGLSQSKIYRFFINTMDEFGNISVPSEIALIPYTASDLEALVVTSPRVTMSPSSAVVEWPAGISSMLLRCYGLTYEYTDRTGTVVTGERNSGTYRFFAGNLETGRSYTVKMKYKIIPLVSNEAILDTLTLERNLTLNVPTATGSFVPAERDILSKNGLTQFTYAAASTIKKLVYPIHANSLSDLFYLSNVEELDLTGSDMFEMTTYTYDRNNAKSTVGGGEFSSLISKVSNVTDTQVLIDLLDAGTLKKVRYMPGTMGLDALLAPYVESGVVELVPTPDEVLIPHKFWVDGLVQDNNFRMEVTLNPSDAPAGDGLQYVYKAIPKMKSASLVIALPVEYKFNAQEYKYFKYRIYAPPKSDFVGANANFQSIWTRFMNNMWAFGGNSTFGQEHWTPGNLQPSHQIPDADLGRWVEYTTDISPMATRHNRVIVFNIGGEKGVDPSHDMAFYLSNFRLSKTP